MQNNIISNFSKLNSIMCIVSPRIPSNSRECPVGSIKELVRTSVVLWPEPFPFHDPRKDFHNVQMWRIRRDVEQEKSPFLSGRPHLFDFVIPVYTGIVKYDKGFFAESEGESFGEVNDLLGFYGFTGGETLEMVVTVNHSEDIESFGFFRWHIYVFFGELPSVGDVSFRTDMGLHHH